MDPFHVCNLGMPDASDGKKGREGRYDDGTVCPYQVYDMFRS